MIDEDCHAPGKMGAVPGKLGLCHLARPPPPSPIYSLLSAWQLQWFSCRRIMSHLSMCSRVKSVHRSTLPRRPSASEVGGWRRRKG